MTTIRRTIAAAALAALPLALASCSQALEVTKGVQEVAELAAENARNNPSNPDADTTHHSNLNAGDCIWGNTGASVNNVEVIDCAQPHHSEIFHAFDLSGNEYDMNRVSTESEDTCVAEFANFVGMDYNSSELSMSWIEPSMRTWMQGDRTVYCLIEDSSGGLEGSMRGANR